MGDMDKDNGSNNNIAEEEQTAIMSLKDIETGILDNGNDSKNVVELGRCLALQKGHYFATESSKGTNKYKMFPARTSRMRCFRGRKSQLCINQVFLTF